MYVWLLLIGCGETKAPPEAPCAPTGFEAEGLSYALPVIPYDEGTEPPEFVFLDYYFERVVSGVSSWANYEHVDLDGDGFGDFVVTRDEASPALGTERWDVYRGGPTGFTADPIPWTLPPYASPWWDDVVAYPDLEASNLRQLEDGSTAYFNYFVHDLDGDGIPDLAVIRDGAQPEVGLGRWDVYLGGADGFATDATPWTLPARVVADDSYGGAFAVYGGSLTDWLLADMNRDGRVDIVVIYDELDSRLGSSVWQVYDNNGSGFDPVREFTLPFMPGDHWSNGGLWAGNCIDPRVCSRQVDEVQLYFANAIVDFDGDGYVDFLLTADALEPELGATHWHLWRGTEDGVTTFEDYTLPAYPRSTFTDGLVFPSLTGTWTWGDKRRPTEYGWMYGDMDGDGQIDLIMGLDDADLTVGTERWDVWYGGAEGFELVPQPWSLPFLGNVENYPVFPWGEATGTYEADGERHLYGWSTLDLDGAGGVDLVLTFDRGAPEVGTSEWRYHPSLCTNGS